MPKTLIHANQERATMRPADKTRLDDEILVTELDRPSDPRPGNRDANRHGQSVIGACRSRRGAAMVNRDIHD
jgi:hypothetical protein